MGSEDAGGEGGREWTGKGVWWCGGGGGRPAPQQAARALPLGPGDRCRDGDGCDLARRGHRAPSRPQRPPRLNGKSAGGTLLPPPPLISSLFAFSSPSLHSSPFSSPSPSPSLSIFFFFSSSPPPLLLPLSLRRQRQMCIRDRSMAQLLTTHRRQPSPPPAVLSAKAAGNSRSRRVRSEKGMVPVSPAGTSGNFPSMELTGTTYRIGFAGSGSYTMAEPQSRAQSATSRHIH